MLVVFGMAKLFGELFEAMHQPAIVGEILAGIVIGPGMLNWVQPNEVLRALSELGVMFLLFRVGLQVKSSELLRVGRTAMLVALLGVLLPFLAGWGILQAMGFPHLEAIFVGAAMVATSVGITAQVLAEAGRMQEPASRIILAAAVIDDVLGLLVLAIVSSLAQGSVNWAGLLTTAVMAVSFTLIVTLLGSRILRRVVPRVEASLASSEAQFNVALVLLFGLALLAVYAGVAAIIGAFLAGMALAETVGERVHDLAHGITELLVPFFLVGIGLNFDVQSFRQPAVLMLALVVLVAAALSKLAGCGLGAWTLGRRGMLQVGAGMIPRGEVGMVVAQLGMGLGIISRPIYSVVVFMAVLTTMMAPPLLKAAFQPAPAPEGEREFRLG